MKKMTMILTIGMLVLAAGDAVAQAADEWEFHLAPLYLWAVNLGGSMTAMGEEVPVEVGFSDAFENLEGVFTLHFEAKKGDWGLFTDVSWLDVGGEEITPAGPITIDFQQTLFELGAGYEFGQQTSVIFGVRYVAIDPTITPPPGGVINPKESWTDAFVGLLWRPSLSDRWNFSGRFDIGAGSSDLVWNAAALFDYRMGRHTSLLLGYRHLDYDYSKKSEGFAYTVTQGGPVVALGFSW